MSRRKHDAESFFAMYRDGGRAHRLVALMNYIVLIPGADTLERAFSEADVYRLAADVSMTINAVECSALKWALGEYIDGDDMYDLVPAMIEQAEEQTGTGTYTVNVRIEVKAHSTADAPFQARISR